ncbi:potassium/sodium hyperpolarization-activated cyclic nucleotide-gated channel 1 [Histomonas meleagridis]|uniref:potassium/sodium hyperpolarization-activated cyclic nucleotide-gated channel 1 n=1 Tax=Histomonas meleagridis TaxID=135588 RepID=UPI0035598D39|nr:potassium/sodium hyperpolarization-activated cyclic nucleotide-gated channel 1 [Histomonas meleagridis]KAH0804746.1 potassium/sodium hyperpolarization-activated cyclic nucleotide-gated channel 1 [Histomonas meleagridis]
MEDQIGFARNNQIRLIGEEEYLFDELKRRIRESKQTFSEKISEIKNFIQTGGENEWRRAIACGIFWIPSGIAVNNRQLCSLLKISNSDLNRSLKKIGFMTSARPLSELCKYIPLFESDQNFAREWHIKNYSPVTPNPLVTEEIPHSKSYTFSSPCIEETIVDLPQAVPLYPQKQMMANSESIDVLSFFDDPFCCLPLFLVEDMQKAD